MIIVPEVYGLEIFGKCWQLFILQFAFGIIHMLEHNTKSQLKVWFK